MIHHYITKYHENGTIYAESWIQVNLFGKSWFLSRRKIDALQTKLDDIFADMPTCVFVDELERRAGVFAKAAGSGETVEVCESGPVTVLVIRGLSWKRLPSRPR